MLKCDMMRFTQSGRSFNIYGDPAAFCLDTFHFIKSKHVLHMLGRLVVVGLEARFHSLAEKKTYLSLIARVLA